MRKIDRSTAFRRDYKREKKAQHGLRLDDLFIAILASLVVERPLPEACRDHSLSGTWEGFYRNCHVRPDLILIYSKPDSTTLQLRRLGSHAKLFG
jgi:mRNA interferase YafQ